MRSVAMPNATGLALFPNPTSHQTTLTGATPGATVQVLDALGRLVATATADPAGAAQLALPTGLATGMYLVRTGQQTLRLTVE
ncbi:MAG: T9SS type A sorting domain-containing protein [Janthinobacterium lividum]